MKIFAILQEPANYTLDIIKNIYEPRGVEFGFINLASSASDVQVQEKVTISSIFQILKSHNALIVNGYTGSICVLAIWLNIIFFKKPMALDSDTELRIPQNRLKRVIKWLWLHFLFTRKYCYGFAGGNYGHKDLFRHYRMPENHIFLMPMVIDNFKYVRNVVARSHQPFRFGCLGRLIPLKQVDKVFEALGQLVGEGCRVELYVIGDGPERSRLEELSMKLPIRLVGAVFGDAKIALLQKIDCLVLYSWHEQWGLVVNEALATGIPVIVSDKVGARRDLVGGENPTGLVAKWNDVCDLKDKMRLIANDSKLYDTLSSNTRKRMEYWSYDLYGKNFDAWLEKISHEKAV